MSDVLPDYLLFLAEAVTVAAVVGGLLLLAARLARAGRATRSAAAGLEVTDLGRQYEELTRSVQARLLPAGTVRRQRRAEAKRRKREHRAAARDGAAAVRPRVFVLDFQGDLRASATAGLRREITAVLGVATPQDEVLVRLSNPGGLVNEQGLAASQLQRVRDRGIRLTVAVDSMAASGGYLMACVADRILAAPFAVIGSIGVLAEIPNFARLLDRVGVDVEQFRGGRYKRTVTPLTHPTEEDRDKLREQIAETHDLFKDFVARHRPGVDLDRVATGEYWYGTRALELGLVDELITSDDYLLAARDRADLYHLHQRTPQPPLQRWRRLLGSVSGRVDQYASGGSPSLQG